VEETVQFWVLGSSLAIRNLETVWRVTWLLHENLCQPDHIGVIIECFCKGDHLVSGILLVTISSCGEECSEGRQRNRAALLSATSLLLLIITTLGMFEKSK
jgi:hypothetical protein